jgi:uncharacterized repeat protein (TIGR01451 family)
MTLPLAATAATITSIAPSSTTIGIYDRYELNFNLTGVSPADYNPFRPDTTSDSLSPAGVNVYATVTTPSGQTINVWAYWDVDVTYLGTIGDYGQGWSKYDKFVPASAPHWKVRYAPTQIGNYTIQIFATDATGTTSSPVQQFTCVNGTLRGFVNLSADGQRFVFSNGTPFIPMGTDASDSGGQTTFIPNLAANGMNYQRRWLTNSVLADIFRESYPETWTLTNAAYDTTQYHTGTRSVLCTVTGPVNFLEEPFMGIRNGTYYQDSVWLLASSNFNGTAAVRSTVHYTDGSTQTFTGNPVTGKSGWTQSTLNFSTSSGTKTADFCSFYVAIVSGTTGSVWADDAAMYEANSDGSIKVNYNYLWNPSYEPWTPAKLRLMALWRFEHFLSVSEQNGVEVQPTIFDYRLWNTANPTGFYENYYTDFFSDPNATAQEDRVLRYLVARYSAFRSLYAWELTNESSPSYTDVYMAWLTNRSATIKGGDPLKHPVTNSYWTSPADVRYAQSPAVDINQVHYYLNTEERVGGQGVPTWWTMPTGMAIDRTPADAHTGSSSLMMTATGGTVAETQSLYLKPSRSYTFQFWIKGSGMNGTAGVLLRYYNVNSTEDMTSTSMMSTTTGGYTLKQTTFTTPADCCRITMTLQLTGSSGTAWIDDVQVIDNTTGSNILYNGGFESGNFGDDEFEWAFYNTFTSRQMYESGPNPTKKPWVSGEFGLMGANANLSAWADPTSTYPRHDTTGLHVHNCIWAQMMADSSIHAPTYWWVTSYINYYGLLSVWQGLTTFTTKLPFYDRGSTICTSPYPADVPAQSTNQSIRAIGQKEGNMAYLWIQNAQDTWSQVIRAGINPSAASANITVGGFANGVYSIAWYNTYTGALIRTDTASVTSSTLTLPVTSLSTDLAAIVTPSTTVSTPNITLTISANKTTANPSDVITYTITYTNTGGVANNMVITMPIPANTTYVAGSATGGGAYNATSNAVTWSIPSLAAGASGSVTASVKVS